MPDRPLPRARVPHPHVRTEASVLGGSPHVAGSRVPVRRLWAWYRGGVPVETLIKRYPSLGPAQIFDALAFAYDNLELVEADAAREQALLGQESGEASGADAQVPVPSASGATSVPRAASETSAATTKLAEPKASAGRPHRKR